MQSLRYQILKRLIRFELLSKDCLKKLVVLECHFPKNPLTSMPYRI